MNIKLAFKKQDFAKLAFPHEHGSWGFFLEPIVLSLIVAYSPEGLLLGISAFLFFLASKSLSVVLKRKPEYLIRLAIFVLLIYTILAIILFYIALNHASSKLFMFPFSIAMCIMILYKYLELKNLNRLLIIELLAPISVILISVAIVILNSWELKYLIAFGIVLLSRSIQTVVYINNKLKFFKDHEPNKFIVNIIGIIFFVVLSILSFIQLTPYLSLFAVILLLVRAYLGFLPKNKKEKVKIVGIKEFIFGFLFVVINSIGYLYNL